MSKKWAYLVLPRHYLPISTDVEESLNILGEDGWELVSVDNHNVYHFKKLKED